ncbi:hypothetical protein TcBrA4_0018210 [Trypanosoma cruzi]|nr:hypothetical protein TcBrA4_0018210 [Trypanosoma cruzi]
MAGVRDTSLNYPLLGGISRALAGQLYDGSQRNAAARERDTTLWCFESNGELSAAWRKSTSLPSQCVFTHWTPNNPELSAAWRNFASSCRQLWSMFLFRIMNGGSQRHVSFTSGCCVFTRCDVSNYEWRESETT